MSLKGILQDAEILLENFFMVSSLEVYESLINSVPFYSTSGEDDLELTFAAFTPAEISFIEFISTSVDIVSVTLDNGLTVPTISGVSIR